MRSRTNKTPIVHRYLSLRRGAVLLWSFTLFPSTLVGAQEAWTVDEAVARALGRPELVALREAGLAAVRAEGREAIPLPAPSLDFVHERLGDDDATATQEFSASLRAELDLFFRRRRFAEASRHRESAFLAEDDRRSLEVAAAVHTAFYAVRYHERRLRSLEEWTGRLERGLEVLRAREERGDASAYEVRRVERELLLVRAERLREESRLDEAWRDLHVWCPWEARPQLVGELAPETGADGSLPGASATQDLVGARRAVDGADARVRGEASPDAATDGLPDELPDTVRLVHLGRAVEAERRAWGAPFLRGWEVGAGYRRVEVGDDRDEGLILSLSVPVPLWSPDGPRRDRLRAEGIRIGSELRLERQRATEAARSAELRLVRLREAAEALSSPRADAEFTAQAEAAYAAGESTLSELLDAYESAAELELTRSDLQWEARRASIELDRLRGTGVSR